MAGAPASQIPALVAPSSAGIEKAAILLLTLGPDAAAGILAHLSEAEVRAVSTAIARLRSIPKTRAAAIHEEAWRWLNGRDGLVVDGEQFVRKIAESKPAGGGDQSQALREIARQSHAGTDPLAANLEPVSAKVIAQVLATEHPQAIAFVLGRLPAKQAADVLNLLPEETQADLILRITDLQAVSAELVAEVGALLEGEVRGLGGAVQGPATGGTKLAADILNCVDKAVEQRVFAALEEAEAPLAESIRNLMLTFEDLHVLENRDMQTLLKEVPREDLMLALKTATPAMRDKIFGNISARAAEILQDDMSSMGPVKLKDVEKAQSNIVGIARRLGEENKITLGGQGGDAVV
jgi:flagellar motor switch protein FliG